MKLQLQLQLQLQTETEKVIKNMKLQTDISDASYKKIISYKAHLEQTGNKKTMSETMDSFIQNAKLEN